MDLRETLAALGKDGVAALDKHVTDMEELSQQLQAALNNVKVLEERLRKAMDREQLLKVELTDTRKQLEAAHAQLATMQDHPDVKAANRARIEAEIERLKGLL